MQVLFDGEIQVGCWKTTPSRASAARGSRSMSWPNTAMRPVRALYRRVISANSVVLPAPFRPSKTAKSPG
jgi:hypothetical protein